MSIHGEVALREGSYVFRPSEKISVIREIASRLSVEPWPIIDLTLRQFGLPTSDSWSGERMTYIINMVEEAGADTLIDLARHLGHDMRSGQVGMEPGFWQPGMFRLFITHLARHKEIAAQIQWWLQRFHISSFVAHNDIHPTKEWMNEIELALNTANGLLALLHPGFKESDWTDQEIGFALGRGTLVVAVRFGQDPYGLLGRSQAIQGDGKEVKELSKEIFGALSQHKQSQVPMAEALIRGLGGSMSFSDAKSNMALVEATNCWTPRFAEMLRRARDENGQVSGAFGIPDRIERLIQRWERA